MKKAVVTESAAAAVVESEVVTVAAKGLVKSIMGGVRVRVLKTEYLIQCNFKLKISMIRFGEYRVRPLYSRRVLIMPYRHGPKDLSLGVGASHAT